MNEYKKNAICFMNDLPYLKDPYKKRNWGSKWHSLCSYHGKLKPSIAHMLISNFTKPGDIILDPLAGVGTIPFEACMQGRNGIGNDLSKLAYFVSKAKIESSNLDVVVEKIADLERYIDENKNKFNSLEKLPYSDFGYNKSLVEYYEKNTFIEILLAREFFKNKKNMDVEDSVIISAIMHILHGNRPYALSRKSHSLTPYSPHGEYIYKSLIEHLKDKIDIVIKDGRKDFKYGKMYYGDALNLHNKLKLKVDAIITSPPFTASLKFYTHNWLRLWFAGWEPEDFKKAENQFIDSLQKKSIDIYYDFFEMCASLLKPKGKLILHLGKSKTCDMARELIKYADKRFKIIFVADEDVTKLEKHGVKDKGGTTHHQFLFLEKK